MSHLHYILGENDLYRRKHPGHNGTWHVVFCSEQMVLRCWGRSSIRRKWATYAPAHCSVVNTGTDLCARAARKSFPSRLQLPWRVIIRHADPTWVGTSHVYMYIRLEVFVGTWIDLLRLVTAIIDGLQISVELLQSLLSPFKAWLTNASYYFILCGIVQHTAINLNSTEPFSA